MESLVSQSGNAPKIIAYLKPHCGWSRGVRSIFERYELEYEDRDIINDPAQYQEMVEKSGQYLQPCVEVDSVMLADVDGGEVEAYLLENQVVMPIEGVTGSTKKFGCDHK